MTGRRWRRQKRVTGMKHSQYDQASGQDAPRLNSVDHMGNTDSPGTDCPVSFGVWTVPTNQLATVFATTSEFACAAIIICISFGTLPAAPTTH